MRLSGLPSVAATSGLLGLEVGGLPSRFARPIWRFDRRMRHVCPEKLEVCTSACRVSDKAQWTQTRHGARCRLVSFLTSAPFFSIGSSILRSRAQTSRLLPARAGASRSRSHTSLFTADGHPSGAGMPSTRMVAPVRRIAAEDIGGPLLRGAYARAVLLSRESKYGSAGRSSAGSA
ncbi:hypothetical protein B0H14DRAFT_978704 [Mycena olivaceomarginata]|nr:hypothetical protein B0H14DRAFT_978704 [Mycena olivaceomarginata]